MDRMLRRLEALLIVADRERILVLSGTGDIIEPDDGVAAIGSGGPYALAAARALMHFSELDATAIVQEAMRIASQICIYTNDKIVVEEIGCGWTLTNGPKDRRRKMKEKNGEKISAGGTTAFHAARSRQRAG